MSEVIQDEMTAAFDEQLSEDLAKKAEQQADTRRVLDEGYYLAQYSKHTVFSSDRETFERKDGTGSFANVLFNVPIGMFTFKLLGKAGRKADPIVEFEKPDAFNFRATFREVHKDKGGLVEESVNGGLMQACAASNGFTGKATADLIAWFENNLCIIHIGAMKASADGKYPARNVVRSIRPYNG